MHEGISEHPIQLDFLIFQNVFQTALLTVLEEKARRVRVEARAQEPRYMIMGYAVYLPTQRQKTVEQSTVILDQERLPF